MVTMRKGLLLAAAVLLAPALPAAAQQAAAQQGAGQTAGRQMIDRYRAVIVPEDRRDAAGGVLTAPGEILARERANYHLSGLRQPGDTPDRLFAAAPMRARLAELVAGAGLSPELEAAIRGDGTVTVLVEVAGRDGQPDALAVHAVPVRESVPEGVSEGVPEGVAEDVPGGQVAGAAAWRFVAGPEGWHGRALAPVEGGGTLGLACTRPPAVAGGAPPAPMLPPQPGMLTLVVAPALLGQDPAAPWPDPRIEVAVDGVVLGSSGAGVVPPEGLLAANLPAGHAIVAAIRSGGRLSLRAPGLGRAVSVPLSGSEAAVAALVAFCATPAGPAASVQVAQSPVGRGAAAPPVLPAPVLPPPVLSGPVLSGEAAIETAFGLWVLGQRPALAEMAYVEQAMAQLSPDVLPPGLPALPAAAGSEGRAAWARSLAARAAALVPPSRILLDLNATVTRAGPREPFRLHLGGGARANEGLVATVPAAVRTIRLSGALPVGAVLLTETDPLPLRLPAALAAGPVPGPAADPLSSGMEMFPGDRMVLRLLIDVPARPEILLPQQPRSGVDGEDAARAGMRVVSALLVRQPRTGARQAPAPETVVHRWDRPAPGTAPPPVDFAARNGLLRQDGRLVHLTASARAMPQAGFAYPGTFEDRPATFGMEMRYGALLARGPERALSGGAALRLAAEALTPLERDRVLPVGFAEGRPDRLSGADKIRWDMALAAGAEPVGRLVRQMVPEMPLALRAVGLAQLRDYSRTLGGFPVELDMEALTLAGIGTGPGMGMGAGPAAEQLRTRKLDFLPMPPETALAFLQRVETGTGRGTVWALLDYRIDAPTGALARATPITEDELDKVVLPVTLERLRLAFDPRGAEPIAEIAWEAPAGPVAGALPEALFETTGASLTAAFGQVPGGAEVLERLLAVMTSGIVASQRAGAAAREAAALQALAREDYIVGLGLRLGPYEPRFGAFPVRSVNFIPVAHDRDPEADGPDRRRLDPPELVAADPGDFQWLPVEPDQVDAVHLLMRHEELRVLARVAPVAAAGTALAVSRPSELWLGPRDDHRGGIAGVTLHLAMAPAPQVAAAAGPGAAAAPVVRPERLFLDPETADLLVLAAAPQVFDRRAFARMLLERLARERAAAQAGVEAPWGRFFDDPDLPLTAAAEAALLEPFADWSRRRAAALGDRLVLAGVFDGGRHPATGCAGAVAVGPPGQPAPRAGFALWERRAEALGETAPAAEDAGPLRTQGTVPLPGRGRVLGLVGRTSVADTGMQACGWGPATREFAGAVGRIAPGDAPYADIAVVLPEMPTVPGIEGRHISAVDIRVRVAGTAFAPVAPGASDGAGFAGVLVLTAEVEGLDVRAKDDGAIAASWGPADWQAARAQAPQVLDILGLRLGMTLDEVAAAVGARMPGAVRARSERDEHSAGRVFGRAEAFIAADGTETIVAVTQPTDRGEEVVALMRHLQMPAGSATEEDLAATLVAKYGEGAQVENGGSLRFWGLPSRELDGYGSCGRRGFPRGEPPEFKPLDGAEIPAGGPIGRGGHYGDYGWPSPEGPQPFLEAALPHCGPVAAAMVLVWDRIEIVTWIFDLPRALEAQARRLPDAAPEGRALKIDL
ncbi:hypothetical protein [Frigidibacter sp. MR17.24]|uniref:hypothetical protein n=1 Tax=Frigidibacter sp. MR17.24 TaxID=3127345 RepID=UPI00301313AE